MRLRASVTAATLGSLAWALTQAAGCVGYLDSNAGMQDGGGASTDAGGTITDGDSVDSTPDDTPTVEATIEAGGLDVIVSDAPDSSPAIVFHGTSTNGTFVALSDAGLGGMTLAVPSMAQLGDVLVAGLAYGNVIEDGGPTATAPSAAWTLVHASGQTHSVAVPDKAYLDIYWAVNATGLATRWSISGSVAGVGWMAAYAGIKPTSPVVAQSGMAYGDGGSGLSAPAIAAIDAGTLLIASYGGFTPVSETVAWTLPSSLTVRVGLVWDVARRSGAMGDQIQPATGAAVYPASTSPALGYGLAHLLALQPE